MLKEATRKQTRDNRDHDDLPDLGLRTGVDFLRFDSPGPRPQRTPDRAHTPQTLRALGPLAWVTQHRRIHGRPFSLRRHKPLEALYKETHPNLVVMKPAQIGISEWAVSRACWYLDEGAAFFKVAKEGLNVGYLFPTQGALGDFSKERFGKLKAESQHLADLFAGGYDDVGFKTVGNGTLYLRGAWSETALLSFQADVLILDEFDRMDPKAVALAHARLRASDLKHVTYISTPTLPGRGIHNEYLLSDQRVWEIHCGKCDGWNELEFFRDVRLDFQPYDVWKEWDEAQVRNANLTLACPSCGAPLDRSGEGRWVARRPEVTWRRGYHMPWYAFPTVDLHELTVKAVNPDPTQKTELFRSDLGLPFEAEGSRITGAMLDALSTDLPGGELPRNMKWTQTTMGVDVGGVYHYRISSRGSDGLRYVRAAGSVRSWGDLDRLMAHYRVRRAVVDAFPENHGAQEWQRKWKGRVYRAFYPRSEIFNKGEVYKVDDKQLTININRTSALDQVYAYVATGAERWPASVHMQKEVREHLQAPVRVVTLDDRGQERASWVHTSPDHICHGCVYDLAAYQTLMASAKTAGLGVVAASGASGWNP